MNLKKFQSTQGKKWLVFAIIVELNLLLFFVMILLFNSYWLEINYYVSFWLGMQINLILLILLLFIAALLFNLYMIYKFLQSIPETNTIEPSRHQKLALLIIFFLFNLLAIILFYFTSSYIEIVFLKIEFYSLLIFIPTSLLLIFLLYPLIRSFPKVKNHFSMKVCSPKTKSIIILIGIMGLYSFSFLYPILFIPASVIDYELPSKPDIIAHRGGSQLGPENTLEVAEVALDYDIVGWEVDIAISYDGVPFLMHDDTLERTTDVEEVFPEKNSERADSFKWKDLQKLNAGSWFVEFDPFNTVKSGILSKDQLKNYEDAKIPSFEEVLNFTRENDLILDFDTQHPPEDHPYYETYIGILFNMTIELMDDLSKIMIPTSSERWLDLIEENDVEEIWTYADYDNTGDGYNNQEYREFYQQDFPIMVYTINSLERFSQLWCLGVSWVKTDIPHKYVDIEEPLWFMLSESYIMIWIVIYIVGI